jgi:hypothetical protein
MGERLVVARAAVPRLSGESRALRPFSDAQLRARRALGSNS